MGHEEEYRWQWIGIMTHYRVNIAKVRRNKPRRLSYNREEIVITESERWYNDYSQCATAAELINVNDMSIPDSWGLELRIISRLKIACTPKVEDTSRADSEESRHPRNMPSIKR